jgi:hypothetical protein
VVWWCVIGVWSGFVKGLKLFIKVIDGLRGFWDSFKKFSKPRSKSSKHH